MSPWRKIVVRPLKPETSMIVKMVAPAFEVFGKEILTAAYQRMLADPEAIALFGEDALRKRLERPGDLAEVLYLAAANIDNLSEVDALFDQMARWHVKEGITFLHYPCLGTALLSAIRDVLGEGASDRILDGWHDGFWYLTETLMEREAALYRKQGAPRAA